MNTISLVILNFNGRSILEPCVQSLLQMHCRDAEILVIDNGSTDDSLDSCPKEARLIRLGANLGFAAGMNAGIRASSGEFVATLNNDIEVAPGWLDEPMRLFASDPRIGIVGCRQMKHADHDVVDDLFSIPTGHLLFGRFGRNLPVDKVAYALHPGMVIGAAGAAAIYRRAMLDEIGLFEESFFAFQEECDLHMRAFFAGWKCAFAPSSVVYHKGSVSFNKVKPTFFYYHERNRIWFIYRNFPLGYILRNLPMILLREFRTFLNIAIARRLPGTYLRARLDGLRGMFAFREARAKNVAEFKKRKTVFERFRKEKIIPPGA